MWLERNSQLDDGAWLSGPRSAPVIAAYRRGVFRAKVNVHALSCHDAFIECLENPPSGAMVWLTFAGLESRPAIIEHSESFRIRLRFTEPFHPAIVDAIVAGTLGRVH